MKLEKFKEKNIKKKVILFSIGGVILLLAGIYLYRTFAIFEENREFNIIKGQVPNQKYDVMLSYNIVNEDGTKTFSKAIPEGKDWSVSIECDHGATGVWDYEEWGPDIRNLSNSRTKCFLNFKMVRGLLVDFIKELPIVTSGEGLYEVGHSEASITYTNDTTAINNLKQTELRYAGSNPNNYVKFNNELWRIIGLVNTPNGQRIKIVRNESIGNYSWDSSESSINKGYGVNEWSQSKLMNLLNNGAYYNRTSGICYNGQSNTTVSCDFNKNGLFNDAKKMIDTTSWNLGFLTSLSLTPDKLYNEERSNNQLGNCANNESCNDSVNRTFTWTGQVGLMYPSDYGYATSNRNCLSKAMDSVYNWNSDCTNNDWLRKGTNSWSISPIVSSNSFSSVIFVNGGGSLNTHTAHSTNVVYPSLYLNVDVKILKGNGTLNVPFELFL